MTPEQNNAIEIAELKQRMTVVEKIVDKIDRQQRQIQDLTIAVNTLANTLQGVVSGQSDLGERIKSLEKVPVQDAKLIKNTFITSAISVIATALVIGLVKMIATYL